MVTKCSKMRYYAVPSELSGATCCRFYRYLIPSGCCGLDNPWKSVFSVSSVFYFLGIRDWWLVVGEIDQLKMIIIHCSFLLLEYSWCVLCDYVVKKNHKYAIPSGLPGEYNCRFYQYLIPSGCCRQTIRENPFFFCVIRVLFSGD